MFFADRMTYNAKDPGDEPGPHFVQIAPAPAAAVQPARLSPWCEGPVSAAGERRDSNSARRCSALESIEHGSTQTDRERRDAQQLRDAETIGLTKPCIEHMRVVDSLSSWFEFDHLDRKTVDRARSEHAD